ncbi:hypothetical protein [Clavibacter michiganensis]|uniref:hypothetical protein n=1 Tax=Clavibacter michiganensis TaxID=28447 RepID=UPI001366336B|nr:hypothetical protein [Clavibacter michiganensis]MDO4135505.1 hypothetical protein [Clavibacter michiganensis]MWJ35963.1 hypothetical protein [Clavibacter michiganensis subsp. michiganensis]
MTELADDEYEELARRLTDPDEPLPEPGWVLTGAAAAAYGRASLLREYGSMEAVEQAIEDARRHDAAQGATGLAVAGTDDSPS